MNRLAGQIKYLLLDYLAISKSTHHYHHALSIKIDCVLLFYHPLLDIMIQTLRLTWNLSEHEPCAISIGISFGPIPIHCTISSLTLTH